MFKAAKHKDIKYFLWQIFQVFLGVLCSENNESETL